MGLRRVNKITFVLWTFTCSFYLLKYRCSTVEAWERRRAIVSVLQACAKMAVSSACCAKYVLGEIVSLSFRLSHEIFMRVCIVAETPICFIFVHLSLRIYQRGFHGIDFLVIFNWSLV
jgi:hypothetical protein